MMDLPEPLTPPDCDLRDFQFMPLDVVRLRDSDLAAQESPEACWTAVLLWCASWHQQPAASLPDDDNVLSRLAGFGRVVREWQRVRTGALRGWIKCSDGRLYHPVVAEKALEAWAGKHRQRHKTECARIKKHNQRNGTHIPFPSLERFLSPDYADPTQGDKAEVSPGTKPQCPQAVPRETPSKGQGEGQGYVNQSSSITTDSGCAGAGAPPPAAALADVLCKGGIEADASDERLLRWVAEGATPADVARAIASAQQRRRKEGSAQPVNVGLVDVILADILAKRRAPSAVTPGTDEWHESASGITAFGATVGVFQGPDEPFPYFKARVFEAAGDGPWLWKARGAMTVSGAMGGRH
ncbi:YdaU family protein [Cupriavidus alkaliphilus]|uniref:YdaU family protein n=1 Tax=Cupriavidus alkaliphilus TaxID=942866 RepID=UPI001793CA83|nr:YdaU family protein [Cupriavidus alkaliphilus]MBB2918311.1 hypothetical protein [Cupriavidus alkaliphilus]